MRRTVRPSRRLRECERCRMSSSRSCNALDHQRQGAPGPRGFEARCAASLYQMRRCGSDVFDVRYNRSTVARSRTSPDVRVESRLCGKEEGMRIMTVAFALGTALVLCNLGAFSVAAHAQTADAVRHPRERPIIRVPVVRAPPYWDSYLVPRYRYRPEDDRVDPCGGPVVPVITYGPQEATVPVWVANEWGLGRVHGRDWPCTGQRR
jgi:hypothetical protein